MNAQAALKQEVVTSPEQQKDPKSETPPSKPQTPEPEPELRCTICGLRACWTR
jgi:hypothetical protein